VNKPTIDSFIIGSRIALAMATAKESPTRSNFARAVKSKTTKAKETSKSSQAPKKRNQSLAPGVKPQDRELTREIARMDQVMALLTKRR